MCIHCKFLCAWCFAAPQFPPALFALPFDSTSIVVVVALIPPLPDESGDFLGVNITYNSSSTQLSVFAENTSFTLTNLEPFTLYTIQAAIVSSGGQGPAGIITTMTDAGREYTDPCTCMSSVVSPVIPVVVLSVVT